MEIRSYHKRDTEAQRKEYWTINENNCFLGLFVKTTASGLWTNETFFTLLKW